MRKKTVDSIIKRFTKTLDDLNEVVEKCAFEAEKDEIKVKEIKQSIQAIRNEQGRAERLIENFSKLIESDYKYHA